MIAIYVRVSSDKQMKRGHSISEQIEAAKSYIKRNSIDTPYQIYNDAGYSADTMNRPALKKLLSDISCSLISDVIFLHIDRVTRDVLDAGYFTKHCQIHNVNVVSLANPIDITTPEGKMNFQFSTVFAEFERAKISQRTKFGLQGGLNKGLYSIGGPAPFGYVRKGNKLYVDHIAAEIILSIFTDFATSTISLRSLCKHYKNAPLLSNGKKIPCNSIPSILKNTIYIGKITIQNKEYTVAPKIISNEIFNIVQKKLSTYSHTYPSNVYLFSNKLYCSHCGKKLINVSTYKKTKRYLYYSCSNKECVCYKKRINESIVYSQLKNFLHELILSKHNDLNTKNKEIDKGIKLLEKRKKEEEKVGKTALLKLVNQVISDDEFKIINSEVKKHITFLNSEIKKIQNQMTTPALSISSLKKNELFHFLQKECPMFEVDLIHKQCVGNK